MTSEELDILFDKKALEIYYENREHSLDDFIKNHSSRNNNYYRVIAEQIAAYKKAKIKIPSFADKILFEKTALEQATNEFVINYKNKLFNGEIFFDFTGGLGIDTIGFSESFNTVYYSEKNVILTKLAKYNFIQLGKHNIKINIGDSIDYLETFPDNYFDLIYVDPARRTDRGRVVDIQYCEPNIYIIKKLLLQKSKLICLKLSPAFDLSEAIKNLNELKDFITISLDGELKEVLLILSKEKINTINRKAVVLSSKGKETFDIEERKLKENDLICKMITKPLKYIYLLDSAIERANLTESFREKYNLKYISNKNHYLTSNELIFNNGSKIYEIIEILPYKSKAINDYIKSKAIEKINFIRSYFYDSMELINRKLKIKTQDGGEDYFIFYADINNKSYVLHCKRKIEEI